MKRSNLNKENSTSPTDQGFSDYLNSWLQWSIQEKQAILIDDWVQVGLCQRQKSNLSDSIQSYSHSQHSDPPKHLIQTIQDQQREIVELIDSRVDEGREELDKLDSSTKNLKGIHSSYRTSRSQSDNNFSQLG